MGLTKTDARDVARDIIANCSDKVLSELALKLWAYQTHAEQASNSTLEDNGVGYNKSDAFPVGRYLRTYLRDGLSALGTADVLGMRKRLHKYAGQLSLIIDAIGGDSEPSKPQLEVKLFADSVISETQKAFLVLFMDITTDKRTPFRCWFPKRHVVTREENGMVACYIPNWLAIEKQLVNKDLKPLVAPRDMQRAGKLSDSVCMVCGLRACSRQHTAEEIARKQKTKDKVAQMKAQTDRMREEKGGS